MPLHTDCEGTRWIANGLDEPIFRASDHFEWSCVTECLMMRAGDIARSDLAFDVMKTIASVSLGTRQFIREVLNQSAARMESHQLHAEADAQHRSLRRCVERTQQREFSALSQRRHELRERMEFASELTHVDVVATADDDAVTRAERERCELRFMRQNDRRTARFDDHREIVAANGVERGTAFFAHIGGDADDRAKLVVHGRECTSRVEAFAWESDETRACTVHPRESVCVGLGSR